MRTTPSRRARAFVRGALSGLAALASACASAPPAVPTPPPPAATAGAQGHAAHPAAAARPTPPESAPKLIVGTGDYTFPVSTQSQRAQAHFDQGLAFLYGFDRHAALRAFEAAVHHDPNLAMAWWGVAMAHGPNINEPMGAEARAAGWQAIQRARAASAGATARERAYVEAAAVLFDPSRPLDQAMVAYAQAMGRLSAQYPDDVDAATMHAEALMDLRPWDYWTADGRPQPGTEETIAILERVLARAPHHAGANHYTIHILEASPNPERAVPAADRLGGLNPVIGHMVHMPGHIYMQVGRYEDAAEANRRALEADRRFTSQTEPGGAWPMYHAHNIHFLSAAAAWQGNSREALDAARDLAGTVPVEHALAMPMMEMFTVWPFLTALRFARYDEVLATPRPDPRLRYTTAMWHYARGMAHAAQGRLAEARREAALFDEIRERIPTDTVIGQTRAQALTDIGREVLSSEIAAREGDRDRSIAHLERAVALERQIPYDEPHDWYQPAAHHLGARLLEAGRASEAEAVYRADLERHPENGWALFGLTRSLEAQGRADEAIEVRRRFERAWRNADIELDASRL